MFQSILTSSFILLLVFNNPLKAQWIEVNEGLNGGQILSIIEHEGKIFAGTSGGTFFSEDNGLSWKGASKGLSCTAINSFAKVGSHLFVATNGANGFFTFNSNTNSWKSIRVNLPPGAFTKLASIQNTLYGLSNSGELFLSNDLGNSWNVITGLERINTVAVVGNQIFAGTANGLFKQEHGSTIWTSVLNNNDIHNIEASNNFLIISSLNGTLISKDSGISWKNTNLQFGYYRMINDGLTLIIGDHYKAYRSTDGGDTWNTIPNLDCGTAFIFNQNTFLAGNIYGIYRSVDKGITWTRSDTGLISSRINAFAIKNESLYAATGNGIYKYNINNQSWVQVGLDLPLDYVNALIVYEQTLLAALEKSGIYISYDNGSSWTKTLSLSQITEFAIKEDEIFAGGFYGLYSSSNGGVNWKKINGELHIEDFFVYNNTLVAYSQNGIGYSTNEGIDWTAFNNGMISTSYPQKFYEYKGLLFVGTANDGVYVTDDKMTAWQSKNVGIDLCNGFIQCFAAKYHNLYIGGYGGVYHSSNQGESWNLMNENLPVLYSSNSIRALTTFQNHLYAGSYAAGVWLYSPCTQPPKPEVVSIGDSLLISSSSTGNQWYKDEQPIIGETDTLYKPVSSGTYTVNVEIGNCISEMSDPIEFHFVINPILEMPNVFTPNDDGFNARFVPIKYDGIVKAKMTIFDKWGNQIFMTKNLKEGWCGQNLPTSIYFYSIDFEGDDHKTKQIKGWFHLLR